MRFLQVVGLLLALPLFVGCGDAEPEGPQGPPVVTEQVQELSTGELLGLDRELILATLPWRGGIVTRTAAPSAAVATQIGVDALTGNDFDRLVLNFRRGTPAPGYRIWSPSEQTVTLCGEERTFEENGFVVQLTPATARADDGTMTVPQTEYALDFPVVEGVELVCGDAREVAWFVRTSPEQVEVRLLHVGSPDRIAIDVRPMTQAEVDPGAGAAADTGLDSNG